LLSSEDFTIREPLFRVGIVAFLLGTFGGLFLDWARGLTIAAFIDGVTLGILSLLILAVRFWNLSRARAIAVLVYVGASNFVFALAQAMVERAPTLDVSIYNNLFILSLFLGIATFLVGRSSSLVFGAVILGVLLGASTLWTDSWVASNIWFEVPAVLGTCFLLFQYRTALDRVLADLQRVIRENKTLRDRERLAALGEMTAGIAHEIKNPLNFVVNFAESSQELLTELETLLAQPGADPQGEEKAFLLKELRQNLADIRSQGIRGATTVQGMLLQARSGADEFQPVDLNELAAECLHLAWLGHRVRRARKNFTGGPTPVVVRGSRGDLSRSILNLCSNALWSLAERAKKEGAGFVPELTVVVEAVGAEARLTVGDNGVGFTPQIQEQLFVPFFTTKPPGAGTGLGLPLTWEVVVDQHQGRIEVEGAPNAGARFTLVLPLLGGSP